MTLRESLITGSRITSSVIGSTLRRPYDFIVTWGGGTRYATAGTWISERDQILYKEKEVVPACN